MYLFATRWGGLSSCSRRYGIAWYCHKGEAFSESSDPYPTKGYYASSWLFWCGCACVVVLEVSCSGGRTCTVTDLVGVVAVVGLVAVGRGGIGHGVGGGAGDILLRALQIRSSSVELWYTV